MIPGKNPDVVMSSIVVAVIVTAATVVNEACGALGLVMFVQMNCIGATTNPPAELKMTVSTPDVRVAVAK